ncbi:MAG: T9SS type A sorting domain-containing protein [Saprospiraceae bacterium]|nr:T9SS type A sorting domain-containing protein [Saprospiraceae bacterium]
MEQHYEFYITIYPNPASHQIFVKFIKDEMITEIQLLNDLGQTVMDVEANEAQQMKDLKAIYLENYFIRIITG